MLHLLSIEHFCQEKPTNCLAACAQMALRHIGITSTQDQLNHLLGLTAAGIPASRIALPVSWGDFLLAWSEFDYAYAAIVLRRPAQA